MCRLQVAWSPVGVTAGKACNSDLQAPVWRATARGPGKRASWQPASSQRGRKQVRQLSTGLRWRLIPVSGWGSLCLLASNHAQPGCAPQPLVISLAHSILPPPKSHLVTVSTGKIVSGLSRHTDSRSVFVHFIQFYWNPFHLVSSDLSSFAQIWSHCCSEGLG